MSLAALLGLDREGAESLPAMMTRLTRPAPPPPVDPVAEIIAEQQVQNAVDAEELRTRLIAKSHQIEQSAVMTRDPTIAQQDAAGRHRQLQHLDQAQRQLATGDKQ